MNLVSFAILLSPPLDDIEDTVDLKTLPREVTRILLNLKGPYCTMFNRSFMDKFNPWRFGNVLTLVEYYFQSAKYLILDPQFKYYMAYIMICFCGLIISEMAYCLHLLDMIVNPTEA